jgi:hypothetical protein
MFKHIIITRFNVKNYDSSDYQQTRDGNTVLSDEWMQDRIELFEKYFLSSLAIQTCKDFYCWVFFDENTKDSFKRQIKQLQNKYSCFEAIYVKYAADVNPKVNQKLASIVEENTKYIITSRLDNDDGYHCRAVEYIQQAFVPRHEYAINLTKGYRYVHGNKQILLKNSFINGPFLSFVEKYSRNSQITTIYNYEHNLVFSKYPTKQIKNGYLWLQNIHGYNLVNDTQGIPTLDKRVLKDFGVDAKNVKLSYKLSFKQLLKYSCDIRNYVPFYFRFWLARIRDRQN